MDHRYDSSLGYFLIGLVVLFLLQDYFGGDHVAAIFFGTAKQAVAAGDGKEVSLGQGKISGMIRFGPVAFTSPPTWFLPTQAGPLRANSSPVIAIPVRRWRPAEESL